MANEIKHDTPLYAIDWATMDSWLNDNGLGPLTAEQADKLMDYVFYDINEKAYDLVIDGYEDLFGEE